VSAVLFRSRPQGAHRRTSASWQQLTDALAAAVTAAADTTRQLAAERTLRGHADALVGTLVQQRNEAAARATAAEQQLGVVQQRLTQATEVIRGLRSQLDRPHGSSETTEIPMPLVVPLWESAARAAERPAAVGRPSWSRAS
jgi:hypothetical protein